MGYYEQVSVSNMEERRRKEKLRRNGHTDWPSVWFWLLAGSYCLLFYVVVMTGIFQFAWPFIHGIMEHGR